jgi:hypothetical protein
MLPMRLGYFQDFKGAETVLLAGTPDSIAELSLALANFVESGESELELHSLVSVSPPNSVRLLASSVSTTAYPGAYVWLCNASTLPSVQAALGALAADRGGHQYFELQLSQAQLMVSINEYADTWWAEHV